jgi:hypothetical protein
LRSPQKTYMPMVLLIRPFEVEARAMARDFIVVPSSMLSGHPRFFHTVFLG